MTEIRRINGESVVVEKLTSRIYTVYAIGEPYIGKGTDIDLAYAELLNNRLNGGKNIEPPTEGDARKPSVRDGHNKGWTVMDRSKTTKKLKRTGWVACIVKDGKKTYVGSGKSQKEAICIAVGEALRHNTCDWKATKAWLAWRNIDIPDDELREGENIHVKNTGWSIRWVAKNEVWESWAYVGKKSIYAGRSVNKASAVRKAIAMAKQHGVYNEEYSFNWLIKNNVKI